MLGKLILVRKSEKQKKKKKNNYFINWIWNYSDSYQCVWVCVSNRQSEPIHSPLFRINFKLEWGNVIAIIIIIYDGVLHIPFE